MQAPNILKFVKDYIFIIIGLAINAFAWVGFLIPAKVVGGGITGLATIIYFITKIPVGITFFLFNAILIGLAIKILGPKVGLRSVFGVVMLSVLLFVFQKYLNIPVIIKNDRLLSAIIGGGLAGLGIAIAFLNGGNSGGTDIIALIVTKFKNISPGKVILYIDIFIIATSYFIARDIETVVYSYVVMGVFAYVLDLILDGSRQSYQMIIMSKRGKEIADRIINEVGRGVTVFNATGWYTKQDVDVLIVIFYKNDKNAIYKILKDFSKDAFISEAKVSAVYGRNFGTVKV